MRLFYTTEDLLGSSRQRPGHKLHFERRMMLRLLPFFQRRPECRNDLRLDLLMIICEICEGINRFIELSQELDNEVVTDKSQRCIEFQGPPFLELWRHRDVGDLDRMLNVGEIPLFPPIDLLSSFAG